MKSISEVAVIDYENYPISSKQSFVKPVPFIITNLLSKLGNIESWSFNTLSHKLHSCDVKSCYSIDGRFGADPCRLSAESQDKLMSLPFTDFIDRVLASNKENGFYYLQQGSLLTDYDELKSDWTLPSCISSKQLKAVNLWIGPEGGVSVLHYDRSNNFLIQLAGLKKVVLYDPLQCFKLYPFNILSDAHHISRIENIEQPDLIRYPRFKQTNSIEVLLKPGETLYIPPYWWHQVYSLEPTISVNIWWHALLWQKMVPAYPRFLIREIWRKFKRVKNLKLES
ncbi:cupin-like domain-containing protein [Legionella parisiensis]|uniref:JmjC domain-containing protein n=1 Tax=Legionella parisiensis TaxID=45071 RepID=A0A1E5JUP2_9GAMM|nr:cupin-like domain-containing protein [Legionella parisiensis]KTD43147.1 eukaryotic small stress protein PASS1 [Legionella parisiensis]OEH48256.1 hypothetical protein lpari_00748 [Legionella parisiensis]STX77774.1 eukaryotic small stress protein [Legionella parisiensis]